MNAPGFGTNSKFRPATGLNIERQGESEMDLGMNTKKVSKLNQAAKLIGGLALGALLISATVAISEGPPSYEPTVEGISEYQTFAHDQLVELDETWTPQSQVARKVSAIGEYQTFAHDQLVELDETRMVGTLLRAGTSFTDDPSSPPSSEPNYSDMRVAESFGERMEVQRLRAETLATTNVASSEPNYSEMRVAESFEERMEVQQVREAMLSQ